MTDWLTTLPACDSTNSWALAHADACPHGHCVFTEAQQAGRGQAGRAWSAPPGCLTATIILHLAQSDQVRLVALAAGLAVCHAIEDHCTETSVAIKWPNDCYLRDRKLAGILCEARTHTQAKSGGLFIAVGIGLNRAVSWDSHDFDVPPISLSEVTTPPEPVALLTSLRAYLLEAAGLITAGRSAALIEQVRGRDWLEGRALQVDDGHRRIAGTGCGIDAEGQLLVATETGLTPIAAGTVRAHRSGLEV